MVYLSVGEDWASLCAVWPAALPTDKVTVVPGHHRAATVLQVCKCSKSLVRLFRCCKTRNHTLDCVSVCACVCV